MASDAELIRRSVEEPQVFEAIFDRHYAAIRRYVARRLSPGSADDIAADVFCIAFDRRAALVEQRPDCPVPAWLYGIATNLVRRRRRDERRRLRAYARAGAGAAALASAPDRHDRLDARLAAPMVAKALASLSADERDVLTLYALAELDYQGIADALQIPIGTVRSRLARARARAAPHLAGANAPAVRKESSCATST